MISWHKVGQKVVCVVNPSGGSWDYVVGSRISPILDPISGEVYTISAVWPDLFPTGAFFTLEESPPVAAYDAKDFRPVYPEIIDQLRTLPLIAPERAKEIA